MKCSDKARVGHPKRDSHSPFAVLSREAGQQGTPNSRFHELGELSCSKKSVF